MKKILLLSALFISTFAFSQVTIINSDTTWSGDVSIDNKYVVDNGATLTIEPGTVIKAAFNSDPVDATALVIAKGAKIIANGTASKPIIFTMAADPLTAADVASGTYFASAGGEALLNTGGRWGGLIILGNNKIGSGADNTDNIEGIVSGQTYTNYGGTLDDDNSGSLKYISIRHGGATIGNGDEINGLTLGGVGNGTIIENIEIISNTDDGVEFFGGNVNVNNLLVYNQTDDAIDIDQAYSGTITNVLVALGEKGDNVFEIDGTESTSTPPVTGSYTIDGVTARGNANAEQEDTYGHWKADATGSNMNIVYTGFKTGSNIEGIDTDTYNNGLTFSNLDFITTDNLTTINEAKDAVSASFSSSEAEVLSSQVQGSGANLCVFSGWTAYAALNSGLCSSTTVGDGTVTFIDSDVTWSGDVTMNGKVVVNSGATLTIDPGTVIKAEFKADPVDATALVVAKGGKIMADGTESLPIIFTALADPLTAADVAGGTYFFAAGGEGLLNLGGLWGGLIILGDGIIGSGSDNTDNIEGIAAGQTYTNYGGTVANDNSGVLDYVSIRHGGATIANGDEINGLTLGGVGSDTQISNIEIISNTDDGVEFFGGNVDINNLLIYNQTDDAIDIDQAYAGTITNAYVALGVKGDNVFEIDGTESASTPPVTGSYTINGVTAIGNANAEQEDTYGHWKADATGSNMNIVFKGFKSGSNIEGIDTDTYGNGLSFSDIYFVTTDDLAIINDAKDAVSASFTGTQASIVSSHPVGKGSTEDHFYTWTAYFASGEGTLSTEDIEIESKFSIYPNPFNNVLNVSNETEVQSLKLYNVRGQLVKANRNSNTMNVSELSKGMYLLEVTTDSSTQVKRVIKN